MFFKKKHSVTPQPTLLWLKKSVLYPEVLQSAIADDSAPAVLVTAVFHETYNDLIATAHSNNLAVKYYDPRERKFISINAEASKVLLFPPDALPEAGTASFKSSLKLYIVGVAPLPSMTEKFLLFAKSIEGGCTVQWAASLEDDFFKIVGGGRIAEIVQRIGMAERESLSHPYIDSSITNAQQKMEKLVSSPTTAGSEHNWYLLNMEGKKL